MTRRRAVVGVVVAATLFVTAGCALLSNAELRPPQVTPTAAPTSRIPTTPPSSPSASATSSTRPASEPTSRPTPTTQVTRTVERYYRILDSLRQKPVTRPYRTLRTVARGEAFELWQNVVVTGYTRGLRQRGSVKVLSIDLIGMNNPGAGRHKVRVSTCIDVTDVDLVDQKGKSVVAKGRPDRASSDLLLELDESAWYVVRDRDSTKKC